LKTEVPDNGEALEEQISHNTVNITEVTSSEREGDYRPGDKPGTQSAELELEETRRTASTAQVIIQEKESTFEGTVTFKTSKAGKTVTPQEVPLIEEVTTEEDVTKLKTAVPEQENIFLTLLLPLLKSRLPKKRKILDPEINQQRSLRN
jgi:titin